MLTLTAATAVVTLTYDDGTTHTISLDQPTQVAIKNHIETTEGPDGWEQNRATGIATVTITGDMHASTTPPSG